MNNIWFLICFPGFRSVVKNKVVELQSEPCISFYKDNLIEMESILNRIINTPDIQNIIDMSKITHNGNDSISIFDVFNLVNYRQMMSDFGFKNELEFLDKNGDTYIQD